MLLEGKNALITGSNRGIGKSILETFAKEGCEVIWAHARTESADFLELPQINKNSNWPEDRKKEAIVSINSFCKSVNKLIEAYDDFVIACDDKFNFPIDNTPVDRF